MRHSPSSQCSLSTPIKGAEYEHLVNCHVNLWCAILVEKLRHSSVFFPIDISAVRIKLAIYGQRTKGTLYFKI